MTGARVDQGRAVQGYVMTQPGWKLRPLLRTSRLAGLWLADPTGPVEKT